MINPKLLDEISAKMSQFTASGPAKDIEKNARAFMGGVFNRLDLVTREEFDVQKELLAKALARIDALEARITQLEGK